MYVCMYAYYYAEIIMFTCSVLVTLSFLLSKELSILEICIANLALLSDG